MPVFRFRRPSHSKGKASGIPRTINKSNIIVYDGVEWAPAKVKCKACGPEICYDAVSNASLRRCLECRKIHKRCIREDTLATTNKELSTKVSEKNPGKQGPKPKGRGRVLRMEAVVITSLPPGRKKARQQEARGPEAEGEEEQLELSSVKQDLEMIFKKSERRIRIMKEQLEEAEKLQKMNAEFLKKFGRGQFGATSDSAPSSSACFSSQVKAELSSEDDKSRVVATTSSGAGSPDFLLALRDVIDETLLRKARGASRKRIVKNDEEIIDLT